MNKVAIIGLGYVGLSLAVFLGSKVPVIGVDSNVEKIKTLRKGSSYFFEQKLDYYLKKSIKNGLNLEQNITDKVLSSDFIFITVGTPINEKNKIDLKNMKDVIQAISENLPNVKKHTSIIIKSTVIPGTTDQVIKPILEKYDLKESIDFDLLTNPEFLKEGSAMKDTIFPHAIVIGGSNKKAIKKLINFYNFIYPKKQNIIQTNVITAEVIKYANNSFLATKLSFINSIANICQKLPGTNVDKIAQVIGMDPRIGNQFLKAGPGYGGSCFPKDLQALISFSNSVGCNPILLDAVKNTNSNQMLTVMNLIKNNMGKLKGKKISILGLAFKENTDDIRESTSISLINSLLKQKCKIFVHDPRALKNTYAVFKDQIKYTEQIKDNLKDSDCAIVMTPWEEYKKLTEKDFLKMKEPLIIDTRRILKIDNNKIRHVGLGIGK